MATTPTTVPQRVSCWRCSETTWMLCWTSSAKRSLFSSLRVRRSTRNLVGRKPYTTTSWVVRLTASFDRVAAPPFKQHNAGGDRDVERRDGPSHGNAHQQI